MSKKFTATISYIVCIVILNALFVRLPFVHAFGEGFSPADALVGIIYIVRDFAQRELSHRVFYAMIIGCALSYLMASATIAIASVSAFCVGELTDWALFTFTQKPLSQRLIISSLISVPLDTYVFLALAHRLHAAAFIIMSLGKIAGVMVLWSIWHWRGKNKCDTITIRNTQ